MDELEKYITQGASRAAPGKSGLHARGEGERVLALESREGAALTLSFKQQIENPHNALPYH